MVKKNKQQDKVVPRKENEVEWTEHNKRNALDLVRRRGDQACSKVAVHSRSGLVG